MNIQRQLQHILQSLATQFPKTWQRVAEKRYVLPKYRQEDYYNQDLLNFYLLDHIMAFGRGAFEDDAPNTAAYIKRMLSAGVRSPDVLSGTRTWCRFLANRSSRGLGGRRYPLALAINADCYSERVNDDRKRRATPKLDLYRRSSCRC